MRNFFKSYLYPVATVAGGIIGVGFLSLPYVTFQVGLPLMLCYFAVLSCVVVVMHVILGQVALKTPDYRRWPGFVEFYFGRIVKEIVVVPMIVSSFGVPLAYLLVGSQFLHSIVSPYLGGDRFLYLLVYFILVSVVLYFGVKAISKLEFFAIITLICSLVIILFKGFSHMSMGNLLAMSGQFTVKNLFLPYGAILFSLWGTALIPETEEMIRGHKANLKKIIIVATCIPIVIYLVFIVLVLSITGNHTSESALIGVQAVVGGKLAALVLFIGVLTTFCAFIAQGLFLKKMFTYDLKVPEKISWAIVCATPLTLYFLGVNSFIELISFVGGFLLGIDAILILLMYKKIGGRGIVVYPFIALFVVGMFYSLLFGL